jgi:hypothetical protein
VEPEIEPWPWLTNIVVAHGAMGRREGMKHVLALGPLVAAVALGCAGAPESSMDPEETELGSSSQAVNGPITCAIQTVDGHYLTAVGGGGRTTDVLHTNATWIRSWERFTLIDSGDGSSNIHYGIQTVNGHYLTAVGGGGRVTDVIHSDATHLLAWEKFTLISQGNDVYAIQTINGHYLTAVGGGGRVWNTIHSDATRIGSWEKFRFKCGI